MFKVLCAYFCKNRQYVGCETKSGSVPLRFKKTFRNVSKCVSEAYKHLPQERLTQSKRQSKKEDQYEELTWVNCGCKSHPVRLFIEKTAAETSIINNVCGHACVFRWTKKSFMSVLNCSLFLPITTVQMFLFFLYFITYVQI